MREQGSGSRRVVETALQKAGLKLKAFKNVMHLDSTETIKSAVEAGLGVGIVSRWAIAKELELRAVKVVDLESSVRGSSCSSAWPRFSTRCCRYLARRSRGSATLAELA
jgi:DNA-binding transcriptional LysR family regulator